MFTHQEKLEAVRQAAIAANPEIVELTFGCITEHGIIAGIRYSDAIQAHQYAMAPTRIDKIPELRSKEELGEIIGRPIRLADVILALRTSNIHEDDWKEELCRLTNKWDARKDSLDEQSEETISFLYELLK